MNTESRRIIKKVEQKQRIKNAEIVLPKKNRISIKNKIKQVYRSIQTHFKKKNSKISFTELAGKEKQGRIATFLPLLHLDNQRKIWLEQENHFDEIYIWLKKIQAIDFSCLQSNTLFKHITVNQNVALFAALR